MIDTHPQFARESVVELTTGPSLIGLDDGPSGTRARIPPRRRLALAILAPLIFWGLLRSQAVEHPAWALALLSLVAGLSLATYVPLRGESLTDVLGSPCATIGGVVPLLCAASALSGAGNGSLLLASGFVTFALYQRLGNPTCRT